MAGLTPLPPTIIHSTTRLTHAQAHTQLSTFLDLAENEAAYRPDSTLTERGPQSASTGGNPNLTLHHLKRILQGIEGKRIGGDTEGGIGRFFGDGAVAAGVARLPRPAAKRKVQDSFEEDNTQEEHPSQGRGEGRVKRRQVEDLEGDGGVNNVGIATQEQDGWQDKSEFEMAQEEGGMELIEDDRQPGLNMSEAHDQQEADDMLGVEIEDTGDRVVATTTGDSKIDKKARKEAKKARNKEERRLKGAKKTT